MIASVAFRNFKALRHAHLELSSFNLVIGPNGSGKTSLIQALLRLHTLARLPLADDGTSWMRQPGERAAEIPLRAGGPEIVFRFAPPEDQVEVRLACVSELVCDLLRVRSPDPAAWERARKAIGGIRGYRFDHEAMALPAERATGGELAPDGGNLAAVLERRRAEQPEAFALLEAEFRRLLPEFTGLAWHDHGDGVVELAAHQAEGGETIVAENLSQGTLYTLAMLTLAFDPTPPSLVCLEEIDRGMHPRMLREVRDLLYRLSYPRAFQLERAPVQVVATTHSPYLLDLFREHPEEIIIAQKHGSEAHFERLVDRTDLAEILAEGSLGDLWYSGILGGVPEER